MALTTKQHRRFPSMTGPAKDTLAGEDKIDRDFLSARDGSVSSTRAGLVFEQQFWQGKSGKDLKGIGCGEIILATPWVASRYPSPSETRLEIEAGEGYGKGSIRLFGPRRYWPGPPKFADASFLVPFAHIEQIAIVPHHPIFQTDAPGFQVIIIPAAATGCSPFRGRLPGFISFTWANKAADLPLEGKIWEDIYPRANSYLSILKKAMNDQLAPFKKTVISSSPINGIQFNADLRRAQNGRVHSSGLVHCLETGILFLTSSNFNLYLPYRVVSWIDLVINRDVASRESNEEMPPRVSFDIVVPASDPDLKSMSHSPQQNAKDVPLFFCNIPLHHLEKIRTHLGARNIAVHCFQRVYYNYERGEFIYQFPEPLR